MPRQIPVINIFMRTVAKVQGYLKTEQYNFQFRTWHSKTGKDLLPKSRDVQEGAKDVTNNLLIMTL
jgi:hypothetical protein